MGTCMGVVPVILIPNQHITILQFVILTEQQIAEELHEERPVWLYSFLRITVIGTYQCVAEVPRVISKQLIIHFEATRTQIFDDKYGSCSSITFTERMVLP